MQLKFFLLFLLWCFLWAAEPVEAALTYGGGYYTNLCDSGTAATYYNCDSGCDPASGSCQGENQGVVKWVCSGKWNQCLESESRWSNYEQVGNVNCGFTVQLSKFDRKCRREDGSWDSGCQLLGYMVWYSGDCRSGGESPSPVPTVVVTPKPTNTPTPVPTATPAPNPTVSPGVQVSPTKTPSPTVTPVPADKVCGSSCSEATDCKAGFACVSGVCRNPACPGDKTCFCQGEVMATASAVTEKSPDTGWEVWTGMGGMMALGWAGMRLRKMAKALTG